MMADRTRRFAIFTPRFGVRAFRNGLLTSLLTRGATPWALSFAAHAALVVLGFFIVWTVSPAIDDEPVPVVVTFDNPSPAPIVETPDPAPERTGGGASNAGSLGLPAAQSPVLQVGAGSALPRPAQSNAASAPVDVLSERRLPEVRFAGLGVSNAETIVYVVDATGSMVSSLPAVLDYLDRSVSRLARTQRFQVIFYGREPVQPAPHPGDVDDGAHWRLIRATPENISRVLAWSRTIAAGGSSSPLAALRFALHLERPDAVFLLSNVITGAGEWELDREGLLAEIDALNPRDPRTGRRRTVIKTLQFYDEDPAGILRAIAEAHGGEGGYRYIPRPEPTAP